MLSWWKIIMNSAMPGEGVLMTHEPELSMN